LIFSNTLLGRLATEGPEVAARYRAEMGTLTSRENWARLYGTDGDATPSA
jgi:galactofuranosylgalactofuranosylrhamnosyl-N-acetylglucosaminyl-diphospho-decaprenol beta-1,5/1,6-galactofuranosyltransferase